MREAKSEVWGAVDFGLSPDVEWVGRAACASGSIASYGSRSAVPTAYCVLGSEGSYTESFDHPRHPHLEVAGDVRLHNRQELIRALGLESRQWTGRNDCALLLAAFEKWGEACGNFLNGEFAFAIWNRHRHYLFCCRDHAGTRPLFYWRSGYRFVFASDPRSILAAPGVPRELNHRKFAGLAILGGQDFYHEDTFHSGIMSLPCGTSLTVNADGMRQKVYWEPKIQPDLVPRRPDDAYEALREVLMHAVASRMPDNTSAAVYLSGGLDSAAVTSLAARVMRSRGGSLLALSGSVPDDQLGHFADEREFANEYKSDSTIHLEYVTAPGAGPFDSIHDPGRFVVSARWNRTLYLHEALEKAAVAGGAQVVLQGLLGELGPTCWGNTYYAQLALSGRWPTMIRELRALQSVEGIHPLRFMAGRFRDLLPVYPGRAPASLVLLSPGYHRQGKALQPSWCPWPDQRLNQASLIRGYMRGHAVRGASGRTPRGHLRVSQPWLDRRVLEFCLSAPPELKVRNGYRRHLLRAALDGILPGRIQWRTSKTVFSPDYNVRYNAQLWKARDFVAEIGPTDPVRSIIDVEHLCKALQPVDPKDAHAPAVGIVPATIYAICFLRQFADYRP
jgi:asparagine synthase (glutamine-hydrolysing)